jgi:conjugal transfer pilus assembly protein TraB
MIDKEQMQDIEKKQVARDWRSQIASLKKQPMLAIGIFGLVSFAGILVFGGGSGSEDHKVVKKPISFEAEKEELVGVKEAVDPRDMWTARLEKKVGSAGEELRRELKQLKEEKESELSQLKEEIKGLKDHLIMQQEELQRKELEESLRENNGDFVNPGQASVKKRMTLGRFNKSYVIKSKNRENYIPAGTFASSVVLGGVVVGTGSNTQSNPEPIILRVVDKGIFGKGRRFGQIKEATLIGSCSGDLAAERARCRLHTLSLENERGRTLEKSIEGWIIGEDGRNGVKGVVIDKSSDMLRMAMLNGVLGGVSNFLKNQATSSVFPISPISGQSKALSGANQLKAGFAQGTGDGFAKVADFVMERFNSMSPQIVVSNDRVVEVVFRKGVDLLLDDDMEAEQSNQGSGNLIGNNSSGSKEKKQEMYNEYGGASFNDAMDQMNEGMEQGNGKGGL